MAVLFNLQLQLLENLVSYFSKYSPYRHHSKLSPLKVIKVITKFNNRSLMNGTLCYLHVHWYIIFKHYTVKELWLLSRLSPGLLI